MATSAAQTQVSPLSTGAMLLTRRGIVFVKRVNGLGVKATAGIALFHPIWYSSPLRPPHVAVNEFEQGASRQFGRDSFQTRSTP